MTGSPWNRRERDVRILRGISRDRHPETGLPPLHEAHAAYQRSLDIQGHEEDSRWWDTRLVCADRYIATLERQISPAVSSVLAAAWWRAQNAWDCLTRWLHWCRQVVRPR